MVNSPRLPITRHTVLADDLDTAIHRANAHIDNDPFPDIPAALLNSADIEDYVAQIGMIHPFRQDWLKPASYSVCVGEKIIFWEGTGDGHEFRDIPVKSLEPGEAFTIPKNSLVFVQTEEAFLLPFYMAARFNLQISLVHKGLLLGTGPLVDPGFRGELLVPLHNLTENDYALCRGDDFIWVEFTKVSPNPAWATTSDAWKKTYHLVGRYRPFDRERHGTRGERWPSPEDYIRRALRSENVKLSPHRSIRNSLPTEVKEVLTGVSRAETLANSAYSGVKDLRRDATIGTIAAIGLAILGLYFGFVAPIMETTRQATKAQDSTAATIKEINDLYAINKSMRDEFAAFAKRLDTLEATKARKTKS
ncbi:MAG: hypothetical protein KGL56_00100 [Alphaproteobacteria bacterium]|nr:hypothetical protein [Alphaproteobacteria bacterium]